MNQRFDDFVTGITVCYKYLQRIKSAAVNEMGLKGSHVMCMFYLRQHEKGLTASQLCDLCAEDKAAISRTLAELRERGYITSGSGKNYRAALKLSEAGRKMAEQFDTRIAQWVCAGGDGLQEEDREGFYRSLRLIANNLRKNLNPTEMPAIEPGQQVQKF